MTTIPRVPRLFNNYLRGHTRNTWIRHQTGVYDNIYVIKTGIHGWAGYIARFKDNSWTKRVPEWKPREWTRRQEDLNKMERQHYPPPGSRVAKNS